MTRISTTAATLVAISASTVFVAPLQAQQTDPGFVPGASFLSNWDANEDGSVTLEELLEKRNDVFAAFDGDEDGQLSAEEYQALDEARTGSMQRPADRGNGAGRGAQALAFSSADRDGNGSVSLEEFEASSHEWMRVMDRDGDGVVSGRDFANGGGGQGPANGQNMRQGQGMGPGQGHGRGQGSGQGQGRGQGQGFNAQMPGGGQGFHPGMQRKGKGQGQAGQQGPGRGHGQGQGQGRGQGQRSISFEGFTTEDGLWIVDGRTGDILLCKSVADSAAPAGFTPVCLEAKIEN